MRYCSWLRHYATSRKVAGSNPDDVDFSLNIILPAAILPWSRLNNLLTEISKRSLLGR
jgi:hypothetical protein